MKLRRIAACALLLVLAFAVVSPCVAPVAKAGGVAKVYRVNAAGVRMRSEPYGYSDLNIMGSLPKGTTCILLSTKGNWWKVTTDKCQVGWVFNRYLNYYGAVDKDTVGICNANKVPVYANYSTSSRRLGRLSKNSVVLVTRYNNVWAEITTLLGGTKGYISVGYLNKAYK